LQSGLKTTPSSDTFNKQTARKSKTEEIGGAHNEIRLGFVLGAFKEASLARIASSIANKSSNSGDSGLFRSSFLDPDLAPGLSAPLLALLMPSEEAVRVLLLESPTMARRPAMGTRPLGTDLRSVVEDFVSCAEEGRRELDFGSPATTVPKSSFLWRVRGPVSDEVPSLEFWAARWNREEVNERIEMRLSAMDILVAISGKRRYLSLAPHLNLHTQLPNQAFTFRFSKATVRKKSRINKF